MPAADCKCENILRAFVFDILDEALNHPKKKARYRAVQTLGALAIAMSYNATPVFEHPDDEDREAAVEDAEKEEHAVDAAKPTDVNKCELEAPSWAAPIYTPPAPNLPTEDRPSCVINEEAHGH